MTFYWKHVSIMPMNITLAIDLHGTELIVYLNQFTWLIVFYLLLNQFLCL